MTTPNTNSTHKAEPGDLKRISEQGERLEPEIDFSCRVCGIQCDIAPDPPARPVCPKHCEDHDYRYEPSERGHYCQHCGEQAPEDWYDD